MITLYKCNTREGFIDISRYVEFSTHKMRGHSFKLQKKTGTKDMKKYSFPNRAIDKWNNLPEVTVGAQTISRFKESYDRFILQNRSPLTHTHIHV